MKETFIKSIIFLLAILIFCLYLAPLQNVLEGYKSYDLTPGMFPKSVDKPILDDFPLIGSNQVSNDSASDIWQDYPIFGVGPYAKNSAFDQITNNIRYNRNPDDGTCSRAEFCGALYYDIKNKSNIVKP